MPPDCMEIVQLLRGTQEQRRDGVRRLFELPFIQYYTLYWFKRYLPRITKKYPEWNDLYLEVISKFVEEVDEGRGPRTNCKAYVSGLCQNLCEKALREIRDDEAFDAAIADLMANGFGERLRAWVEFVLNKMDCRCNTLLRWRYLQTPPEKDKHVLVQLLKEECGRDYAPGAVAVHLHDCRNRFRGLAAEFPFDFDDNNP